MVELETERLRMRMWREADLDAYARAYADPDVARFIGGVCDRPAAWRRMATEVGHWTLRGYGVWAVEAKDTGTVIGGVGLWQPEGWPELEVGYWLLPEGQGKGYATEACVAARHFAYETLGARTLISLIHPDNEASKGVAERLGATLERTIDLLSYGPHHVYRHPGPATPAS